MAPSRSISLFQVGCGNCTLICVDDLRLVFDLHGADGRSSFQVIKPYLREQDGIRYLDVLCLSHGDQDHCEGFAEFKEEMDAGRLVVAQFGIPTLIEPPLRLKAIFPRIILPSRRNSTADAR